MGTARRIWGGRSGYAWISQDFRFFTFLIGALSVYYGAEGVKLAVAIGKNAVIVGALSGLVGAFLGLTALVVVFVGVEIGAEISSKYASDKQSRPVRQARRLLELNIIIPRKITEEYFGDLLESLEEMAETMPGWRLKLHILNSIALAILFTLRQKVKTVLRKDSTHG